MLRQTVPALLNLFFPPRCLGCNRLDVLLCDDCAIAMNPATGIGRCGFCAAAWSGENNCPRCYQMADLEGVRARCEMSGVGRKMVHALKYRYYREAARPMAALMADLPDGISIDRYFAVPLHRARVKERGFNQSELLLQATGWFPVGEGLIRTRRTSRQVGQRLGERRANVAGAFTYSGPRLDGQTVALIDDVVTTGATVLECARTLKDAGARAVWAFAFARASYRPETLDPIEE